MLLKIPDTLTLETEADVRALRDLLDCYLRLSAPTTPAQTPSSLALSSLPEPPPPASDSPTGKKTQGKQPTLGPKYYAALKALGVAGSGEEVYQKFLELGYVSKARHPTDAIKTYLRHRDDLFVRLPPDAQGVTRWRLKEEA